MYDATCGACVAGTDPFHKHADEICPACERPPVGTCPERADGVHPDMETYADEMLEVLSPEEYKEWASETVGAPPFPSDWE